MAGEQDKPKLTPEAGQQALRDHAVRVAQEARERYGGVVDAAAMQRMLQDELVVRYPTTLCFDAEALEPGEFAFPQPLGQHPSDGFRLCVHPYFEQRPDALPLLIAYHLVRINYGEIAGSREAESFGAALLGLGVEEYYQAVCALADELYAHEGG